MINRIAQALAKADGEDVDTRTLGLSIWRSRRWSH
jgi:hypothetical protein